ncbi:MAG: hypothetical protein WCO99_15400, partial [Planctomycetota bacterium]
PYILAKTLLKARAASRSGAAADWESCMLLPDDYSEAAIRDTDISALIEKMSIVHGGRDYDDRYPEGIPTSVEIEHLALGRIGAGLVTYPLGHARADVARTAEVVDLKFDRLVAGAVADPRALRERMRIGGKNPAEMAELYAFPIHGCDPG